MTLEEFQRSFYQKLRRRELPVYAGNFAGGVQGTLSETFSVAREILGEKRFESLCRQYSVEGSFQHWSRYRLGEEFANWFLSKFRDDLTMHELLRYEWAQHEVNLWMNSPLPANDRLHLWLAGTVSEGIQLSSACRVEIFKFDYQKMISDRVLQPGQATLLMGIDLEDRAAEVLLSDDEKHLCENLAGHLSFEQWIEKIPVGSHLESHQDLGLFLQKLIGHNWLAAVR